MIHSVASNGMKIHVQFHNGAIYEYDLPVKHFDALLKSPSAGKYFNQHIKPHPSKCIRLPGDKA